MASTGLDLDFCSRENFGFPYQLQHLACCSQSNPCSDFSIAVSFFRDDCTQVLEEADFVKLFPVHLELDVHLLAAVHRVIALFHAHPHDTSPCTV